MSVEEILPDYEDLEREDIPRRIRLRQTTQPDKAYRAHCVMKFLIDAQLPRRLAHQLRGAGFETTHTLDLPHENRTLSNTRQLV